MSVKERPVKVNRMKLDDKRDREGEINRDRRGERERERVRKMGKQAAQSRSCERKGGVSR